MRKRVNALRFGGVASGGIRRGHADGGTLEVGGHAGAIR